MAVKVRTGESERFNRTSAKAVSLFSRARGLAGCFVFDDQSVSARRGGAPFKIGTEYGRRGGTKQRECKNCG